MKKQNLSWYHTQKKMERSYQWPKPRIPPSWQIDGDSIHQLLLNRNLVSARLLPLVPGNGAKTLIAPKDDVDLSFPTREWVSRLKCKSGEYRS